MKPLRTLLGLLALAAVLMAIATLHYALHHRERESTQPYREPEDGVQPWDAPLDFGTVEGAWIDTDGDGMLDRYFPNEGDSATADALMLRWDSAGRLTTEFVDRFDPRCAATGLHRVG